MGPIPTGINLEEEMDGMAVEITGRYSADLRMRLTHVPSGSEIETVAPLDNGGDGSAFSPTDLLAAALGSCMVTTMAIVAAREGIPFGDAEFRLEKHMRNAPRRVDRLPVRIRMPAELPPEHRRRLEAVALSCPVKLSLSETAACEVVFDYP